MYISSLFAACNYPYLGALAFVVCIAAAEVFSLMLGHLLSAALDTHIDIDGDAAGAFPQLLNFLNVGRVPLLIILCLFAGIFGLSGILAQHAWTSLSGAGPLSNSLLAPVCLAGSVLAVHFVGKFLSRWLPKDESTAISEALFIGRMAEITGPEARPGMPCEAKFTDKHGQTHYLLLEPEEEYVFRKGDRVLITGRLSDTRYLAETNPWPNHL